MTEDERVHIIGIGDDGLAGLTQGSRDIIEAAQVVMGSAQTLRALSDTRAKRQETTGDLQQLLELLDKHRQQRTVILTTGDPLFYGVARYLCEKLGKARFVVVPHVSTMQMAFARVKESWDEAFLANMATLDIRRLVDKVRVAEKVGLFTSEQHSPASIARILLEHRLDYFTAFVCENLGSPDERVTQGSLVDITSLEFSPLNIMILVRNEGAPDEAKESGTRLFGNPDETFLQTQPKRGLLTPMEVRAIALALLNLHSRSTVWDIGAGSGSVSIEAARIAAQGAVYAIEMSPEDHQLIQENASRCGAGNVHAILGKAPEAFEGLPRPDAIFVGGTGRTVSQIVEQAYNQLESGGSLVINVGSLENLAAVPHILRKHQPDVEIRMINVAHATDQLDSIRFESNNPTFLISCVRS